MDQAFFRFRRTPTILWAREGFTNELFFPFARPTRNLLVLLPQQGRKKQRTRRRRFLDINLTPHALSGGRRGDSGARGGKIKQATPE